MFNPIPSKKVLIPVAAICGLAVSTNISLLPNLPWRLKAKSANGPFLPSITLLNSSKLNSAPCASRSADCSANSVAFILYVFPLLLPLKLNSKL